MDSAIVVALVGVGGSCVLAPTITAIINYIQNHKGQTAKRLDAIEEKIERSEAQRARTQILRFADEVYIGQLHSKEHFEEILEQMSIYNDYCAEHPQFRNERTVMAQAEIKEIYKSCIEKHSFLGERRK